MDGISTGVCIAFAMECYEAGILTKEDTDGIELVWGSADAMLAMIHKIAKREGIGDLLADGVKKAAEKIGKGRWARDPSGWQPGSAATLPNPWWR